MKELARYKNIILATAIIVVSLFFLRNFYFHYAAKLAQLDKEGKDIGAAQAVMQEWEVYNSQLNKLKSNLFKEDTLAVKKFIEEKAKASNIELASLKLSRFDKGVYWEVRAQLQVTCNYQDFVKFVDLLAEKSIEITNASLNSSQYRISVSADLKGVIVK